MRLTFRHTLRIAGILMAVTGISMLPSFLVSIFAKETDVAFSFLILIVIYLIMALCLVRFIRIPKGRLRIGNGLFIVTVGYFAVAILGALPYFISGSVPSPVDSFFESCSGFSTTGATIVGDVETLPLGILFWRSSTSWLGGLGILVLAIAFLPSLSLTGQNLAAAELPGPVLDSLNPKSMEKARFLVITYSILTILEIIFLKIGGMTLFDSCIHSMGSISTGGFSSFNDLSTHFNSNYIRMIIIFFMFIGSVDFNRFYNITMRRKFSMFKDSELFVFLVIIFSAAGLIFLIMLITGTYSSIGAAASDSVFQTVSVLTTTGYAPVDYDNWPRFCQVLLLFLMIIGGCTSSTSGGLKVCRIIILYKLMKHGMSIRLHNKYYEKVKLNGRSLQTEVVSGVANYVFLFMIFVFVSVFLVSFQNLDLTTSFTAVISCISNVGPAFGIAGPSSNFGVFNGMSKIVLSLLMIAGRVELYTFFVLLSPKYWRQNY